MVDLVFSGQSSLDNSMVILWMGLLAGATRHPPIRIRNFLNGAEESFMINLKKSLRLVKITVKG